MQSAIGFFHGVLWGTVLGVGVNIVGYWYYSGPADCQTLYAEAVEKSTVDPSVRARHS